MHHENDPLLLFLVRPPDVAICVQTSKLKGTEVSIEMARTDVRRNSRQVTVAVNALPGSLMAACVLLAEWAAELRGEPSREEGK